MIRHGHLRKLSDYTSLKIGGPASFWLEPENIDDIIEAVSVAEDNKKALAIIGKGTNILARDRGFDGVLINLGKEFDYIEREEEGVIKAGGALSISRLVNQATEWRLGGCEFLSGIPGSFGGAVFMNAGVRDVNDRNEKREVRDIILDVDVIDLKGKKAETLKKEDLNFAYRSSGLEGRCLLGARIRLKKDKTSAIINRTRSFMKKRCWIQKLQFPSAGSVFKNPHTAKPAGELIERCHLKGRRIGGAEISRIHANFIVNIGGATSKDVLGLIDLARDSVRDKFNIDLELELKII